MSISVNQPTQPTIVVQSAKEPGCLIQAIWFLVVGWWLGAAMITLGWILNITIIGLPLGMALLNNVPKALALQNPERYLRAVMRNGVTVVQQTEAPQLNFFVRMAFFLLIGWWWSGIWLSIAFALCATIILLPIGLEMFRLTPMMTTLKRY
jgi:uncharacterized membrane protein YccF (DUF307 family)